MQPFPPGTVGVLTGELTRYAWAMSTLMQLQIPAGSQVTWVTGHWVSHAVNRIIGAMRPEDEWVCLMTDDNPCPPDMLLRLLGHNLPLVAPLVCLRFPPYGPSLFHVLPDGAGWQSYTWEELAGKQGLLPVDSFGGPGVVIRREVLEKVGTPFFENMPGLLGREDPHEDVYSFGKCRAAGYQPVVDLDCRLGHCIPAVVTPAYDGQRGRWGTHLWSRHSLGVLWPEDFFLTLPTDAPAPLEDERHAAPD